MELVESVENPSNLVNVAIKVSDLYERMGKEKMLFDWCPNLCGCSISSFEMKSSENHFGQREENFSNISLD